MNQADVIDFIGVGRQRSGTNWLTACLKEHPDVLAVRDLHFFNTKPTNPWARGWSGSHNYEKGIDWYLSQFPLPRPEKIRGEICQEYLTDQEAHLRIKEYFPNVKIMVMLRNPVDFIYSFYWWWKTSWHVEVPSDFAQALRGNEKEKLMLHLGCHSVYLKKYIDTFGATNVLPIVYFKIKEEPNLLLRDIYDYLGISRDFKPVTAKKIVNPPIRIRSMMLRRTGMAVRNMLMSMDRSSSNDQCLRLRSFLFRMYAAINMKRASYPKLDAESRIILAKYYRSDIMRLQDMIDEDLSRWLEPLR